MMLAALCEQLCLQVGIHNGLFGLRALRALASACLPAKQVPACGGSSLHAYACMPDTPPFP